MSVLNAEQIKARLPHREPFLFVDEVVELSEDKIVAKKHVRADEWYFKGHFPGAPVMPGVLQVEAMAQAGGILAGELVEFDPETQLLIFMTIDGVKFRKQVVPGDELVIEVVPTRKGKIFKAAGKCMVGGAVVSQAEFMATIVEKSKAG